MHPSIDARYHPLFLSPRRGLDVNPYEPAPKKRAEIFAGPHRPVRERTFHVQHLALEVDVEVARASIAGVAHYELTPFASGTTSVEFDAAELAIRSVRTSNGRRLRHSHDGSKLTIRLDRPYDAGETVSLVIHYRGNPRTGLWFVRPDRAYPARHPQAWSQGQAQDSHFWFPCHDHPNDKFTSEVVVTADARFRTVSNGTLVSRKPVGRGRRVRWHWKFAQPHPAYLMTLAVAPFIEKHGRAPGAKLRFYTLPGRGKQANRLYRRTADMVKVFTRLFGTYPWGEYSQITISEYTWGGMENTGATTLTEKALLDDRAAIDVSYEGLVSHELAHQWWGDLVTCRGWHHNWLNESWATHCENLYNEKAHGADVATWDRLQKFVVYLMQDVAQYRRPIVWDRYKIPMDLFDRHAYEKGSLVLTMLRDELGDEAYFRGAQLYLARHAYGFADTHEFRRAMEDASGRDLNWFFDQWVFAAGYPELAVTWRPTGRGTIELVVRQAQSRRGEGPEATPLFRLGLDVVTHGTRGDTRRRVIVEGDSTRIELPVRGRAVRVAVDPDFRALAVVRVDQAPEAWRHALARDPAFVERLRAARMLGVVRGAKAGAARRALLHALATDLSPQVRMAAALALGEGHARGRAGAFVRRALAHVARHDRSADARRGATVALGLTGRKAEDALLEVRRNDRSYLVQAAALKALASIRSPRLLAAAKEAMDERGWRDLVPMAALDALAMAPVPGAYDLAYAGLRYGETQEVREAAIRLLVALSKDKKAKQTRPEQAKHVVPTLIELMQDPSVFIRLAAVQAAAGITDPRLAPALRRVEREEAWDYLTRSAGKSLAALAKAKKRKR